MFDNIRKPLITFSFLLIIPIIAIIASNVLSERYNDTILRPQLQKNFFSEGYYNKDISKYDVRYLCSKEIFENMRADRSVSLKFYKAWLGICNEIYPILDMSYYSEFLIYFAFVLIFGLLASVYLSRKNRFLLLIIFRVCALLIPLAMIVFIIGEGVLLLYVLFYGQVLFMDGRVFIKPLLLVGLFVIFASFKLIVAIISQFKAKSIVIGYSVTQEEQPLLWKFVKELSDKIKTDMPDNIILGLGCEYYVTQSSVVCISGNCVGKTLFISITLLNKISQNELKSIIAHELSHFKGNDTLYTLHFYPAWKRLNVCLNGLKAMDSIQAIPYVALLDFFIELFKVVEAKFDREREKIADLSSAKITSGRDLALALAKLYLYSSYWEFIEENRVALINDGKIFHNEDAVFESITKDLLEETDVIAVINSRNMSHPTDTHPTFLQRLNYLKIDPAAITAKALEIKEADRASKLIEKKEEMENLLSDMEYAVLYKQLEEIKKTLQSQ